MRYEPPSPVQARYVTRDVEHHGQTVPQGSAILLLNASANRDEAKFPDADRFDIHRKTDGHLSFGFGIHFCLGAALARLEGRVALDEVLTRFPEWEIDWDNASPGPHLDRARLGVASRLREVTDDIEAIRRLKARYFRTMDTKDWAAMRQVFTDDVVIDTTASGGSVVAGRRRVHGLPRGDARRRRHRPPRPHARDRAHVRHHGDRRSGRSTTS